MRLTIRRGGTLINELRFTDGPVYIGRKASCQIYLPDRTISRQHAVLFTNATGQWFVQDLQSSNCTLLNGRMIQRDELHEGDVVGIADFCMEVHFDQAISAQHAGTPVDMDDTMVGQHIDASGFYKVSCKSIPMIHLNAKQLQDLYYLNLQLFGQTDEEALLESLASILIKQLKGYHIWIGLRETSDGPLTCHKGLIRDGSHISIEGLAGKDVIRHSIQEQSFMLLTNFGEFFTDDVRQNPAIQRICSAIATPITSPAGVYGVIYLDNGCDQDPYSHHELHYLMLISTQLSALVEHIG